MTERSRFWAGTATGDAGPYTDQQMADVFASVFARLGANVGVLAGVRSELAVTGATSPVSVAAGGAVVDGNWYDSDGAVTVVIPTPVTLTRIDRVVLRKSWSAQTVRITRIAGSEGGAAPAMTQVDGTTWDIPLAQCSITTGGAITNTDEREFANFASSAMPVGSMVAYGGATAPSGWLLCYGQAVSRTTYALLFAAISTAYGVGDGSTTFNLPDKRGRVSLGKDNMGGASANRVTATQADNIGQGSGLETHTLTAGELAVVAAHTHVQQHTSSGGGANFGFVSAINADNDGEPSSSDATRSAGGFGSGTAHNNVQPYQTDNVIIKT